MRREEFFALKRAGGTKKTCLYCNHRNRERFQTRVCGCDVCAVKWIEMMLIDVGGREQNTEP